MSNQQPENLPDIDAGLKELSTELTAADLLRKEGQRKKLKVINRNQLKAQIQQWIHKAVNEGIAERAGSLSEAEREELMREAELRVQEAMSRSQSEEAARQAAEAQRAALESQLNQLATEHNASEELQSKIAEMQELLQRARMEADEAQQDVLAMEQDLENIQKIHQATRSEKEKLEDTIRSQMRYTMGLVGHVMGIDVNYYGNRHQEENPVDDDAPQEETFYHDFVVGEKVLETLTGDLARLRDISDQQAARAADAEARAAEAEEASSAQPMLLDQDLALLEQLKSGSLNAVEMAAPVENLLEAVDGARTEVMALRSATDENAVPLTALPENAEEDPNAALQAATHVVRELSAALIAEREKLAALTGQGDERDRANQALRENMIRTSALVQQVMDLDAEYYGSRHQEENPPSEDAEGQEAFYHDFDVGAKVITSLQNDLSRLRDLTKDQEKYSGLLDSDLQMLEQLKEGSLHAMDVAEPVGNLVEALEGARGAVLDLNAEATEALGGAAGGTTISALPDPDDEPAEVLAGATAVARELAAALTAERKRLQALKALADDADVARQNSEQELESAQELVNKITGSLAEQARDFGVDVPAEMGEDVDPAQRLKAAEQVLDRLHAKLEENAATVDELSAALDEVSAADGEMLSLADDQHASQRAVLGELKDKVVHLSAAYQTVREAYLAARRREQAQAAEIKALAGDLDPEFADDEKSEVGIEAGKVDEALSETTEVAATAEDAVRSQQLGGAIEGLIASMRKRASEGGMGGAPTEEVEELAKEVVEIAKSDDDMAGHEVTVDLAMSLDDESATDAKQLLTQTRRVVEVLAARRLVLSEDLAAAQDEKQRLLTSKGELSARVEELVTDLESTRKALEQAKGEAEQVAALQERITELETELEDKSEAVLSGKEVITHLSDKEKRIGGELESLRSEQQKTMAELQSRATRLAKAEDANRRLTESLSEVSQGLLADPRQECQGELEEARLELELALSELPAEDQTDVPMREDLADDLAAAGSSVIERIKQREEALVAAVQAAEAEVAESKAAVESARSEGEGVKEEARSFKDELQKAEARLESLRKELDDNNEALSAKAKDLSQTRDELTAKQADFEAAQRRAEEQDEQILSLQADTTEADKVREQLAKVEDELRLSQEVERDLASSINELAGWSGSVASEFELQQKRESQKYTRSRDKLEKAASSSDTGANAAINLRERSGELVEQIKGQGALIMEYMRDQKGRMTQLYADNDEVRGRISSLEATVADRENQLGNLRLESEQALGELEGLRNQVEEAQGDATRQKDLLLQARAALEEFKAREGERGGGAVEQLEKARQELDQEREAREEAEANLTQLREDLEATIAGLRHQIDGFNQRIADRDTEISRLSGELDEERSQRLDTKEGQARLQGLQAEIEHEKALRAELERQLQEFRGGVGEEMTRASKGRDELMSKLSKLEEELSVARGEATAMRTAKDNLRSDMQTRIDKVKAEKQAEIEARTAIEKADQELREELAGLRARVRTLTNYDDEG
ncbi:MAG: hypothetical protein PF961_19490 [Planctomycetota bacterium]|jgi:chromosome segregation ATPase|nr:hypothetical protein [Planctomycetota bacterium]